MKTRARPAPPSNEQRTWPDALRRERKPSRWPSPASTRRAANSVPPNNAALAGGGPNQRPRPAWGCP
eukprot:5155358-Lingulodinium_polyedra.AAC.1